MRRLCVWMGIAVAGMWVVSAARGAFQLGDEDSFNSGIGGNWNVGGDDGYAVIAPVGMMGPGAAVSNATLTARIAQDPAATNVWIHLFAKPVKAAALDGAPGVEDVGGAFYITDLEELMSYYSSDGSADPAWHRIHTLPGPVSWYGFSVHVDYDSGKWDLYYTTNAATGVEMIKANSVPMFLAGTGAMVTDFSIQSGDEAVIDEFKLAKGYREADNGVSTAVIIPAGAIEIPPAGSSRMSMGIGNLARYFTSPNNTLSPDSALGAALLNVLPDEAEIALYYDGPDGRDYYTWRKLGGVFEYEAAWPEGAPLPAILPTTPVWLTFPDGFAGGAVRIALAGEQDAYTPDLNEKLPVRAGFTPFAWPYSGRALGASPRVDTMDAGDSLYVYDVPNQRYVWYLRTTTGWTKMSDGSDVPLREGTGWWYQRLGSGTTDWSFGADQNP